MSIPGQKLKRGMIQPSDCSFWELSSKRHDYNIEKFLLQTENR